MNLQDYLNTHYAPKSRLWHLVRIAFLNDYHSAVADTLWYAVHQLDKDKAHTLYMSRLVGAAKNSVWDWMRTFDPELATLRNGKEASAMLIAHFQVRDFLDSEAEYYDLVHGEGAMQRIKDRVTKSIKDETKS